MLRALRLLLVTYWLTLLSRLRRGPLRPSWSFMFEWMIRMLRRDWDETAAWPLARQRAVAAARPYPRPHVKKVSVSDEYLGGVPVRRFTPPSPGATRIVYFHGGSYVYGSSMTSHADFCAHLALATSLEVVGVEYRLAPEHTWPAQLEDATSVCKALHGAPLILAGDSAGGHLATSVASEVHAEALVLLSPWVDLEMPGRSFVENDAYDFGTREVLRRHASAVAGTLPVGSLSLTAKPLGGLPPCFLSVGSLEIPRDDILAFGEKLRAAGVDCTLQVADEMPHNPALFEAYHPSGKAAFEAAANFIRSHAPLGASGSRPVAYG
jgi:acetyl esterase/lipase